MLSPAKATLAARSAAATKADRAAAMRGNQAFASRLYGKLRSKEGNLFFSPTSVRVALAMVYAGARGNTAAEMKNVLALEGPDSSIHAGFAALLRAFEDAPSRKVSDERPDFARAEIEARRQVVRNVHQLWGQEGRAFTPSFQTLLESHYAAPLELVDFLHAPEDARAAINTFVHARTPPTPQTITDIIPAGVLNKSTKLVHEALADVDEKGAGAEAATPVGVMLSGGTMTGTAPPPIQYEFRADHPFLFFFYDLKSNAVLFMGRVVKPNG